MLFFIQTNVYFLRRVTTPELASLPTMHPIAYVQKDFSDKIVNIEVYAFTVVLNVLQ